jgi:hypothetical protein
MSLRITSVHTEGKSQADGSVASFHPEKLTELLKDMDQGDGMLRSAGRQISCAIVVIIWRIVVCCLN